MTLRVRSHTPEHLIVVTLNHHRLSLKELPQFTFTEEEMDEILHEIYSHESIKEIVGLCTCNRTEFFLGANSVKDAAHAIVYLIAERKGVSLDTLRETAEVLVDPSAVEHLLNLATGLDSMVIGDAQIFGQLKEAYNHSVSLGIAQKTFHSLFQKTFSIAKKVKSETGLGKGKISISSLAVDHAQKFFGSMDTVTATVIGAGKMGSLTAKYLQNIGLKELRIANRSVDNGLSLAREVGATAYGLDELDRLLLESDLIICSTASPEAIITKDHAFQAIQKNPKPRLIIDIGIPPDVDTDIADIKGIHFVDLELLRGEAAENHDRRSAEIQRARAIIEEEMQRIGPWPLPIHIDSLANKMGQLADTICQDELQTLFEALPELTPEQKQIIKTQMARLAERIVLAPRRNIRKNSPARTCPNMYTCIKELFTSECGARSIPALEIHEKK